ncbi:DUF4292 domain-containing protein [Psychroserpens sp. NJDZ02]|uniref:DUF4292 domain-containing protein n=1 Tax=Psychroserpens sp. NJDZ02 TaxID=2570561 RepID=UPI0010A78A54|nr:DUF4292 domain-containing protein [Psychroserpens sp. NJDZ02]QCE41107.1 DUF4292 domain-containing protein [Psychroserpens sp. NJDZ02]
MTFKTRISFILLLLTIVVVGCKSTKTVVTNGAVNSGLTTKQLIRNSTKANIDFNTLVSRLKIETTQKGSSKSYTVNLKIEKDKQILITSTPISIIRALITPDRVAFYNKWDNTFFDGDFTYLSKLLGTELDFNKVQNLLLGESIFDLNDDNYDLTANDKSYVLQPKKQRELFDLFLFVNPSHYKMDAQEILQPKEKRMLHIDYLTYQEVDKNTLPEQTKILAIEDEEELEINLELKSVKLNENIRFPFKIPSGFTKIEL